MNKSSAFLLINNTQKKKEKKTEFQMAESGFR